ncbi:MAG: hypothetical protein GY953_12640 [bacterium]|nr:hypothetical protein [bacterium]
MKLIDRLKDSEAAVVLQRLRAAHPELEPEAEAIAAEVLAEVDFHAIADDIESAILDLGYDTLNCRSGRQRWGYVEPSEAAWEILEEEVEPFVDEMKRGLDMRLENEARQHCQGILLGLYQVRGGSGNDVLQWAEDFPPDKAADVISTWSKHSTTKGNRRAIDRDFVNQQIPEWKWILKGGN